MLEALLFLEGNILYTLVVIDNDADCIKCGRLQHINSHSGADYVQSYHTANSLPALTMSLSVITGVTTTASLGSTVGSAEP